MRNGRSVSKEFRKQRWVAALGLLLWAGALWLLVWQGEWRSLRGSPMVAIPLRFEEAHVRQRPWLLSEMAPPVPERIAFAGVYGLNVVRQEFRCPADNLSQVTMWVAGPRGQPVKVALHSRTSGLTYAAERTIDSESGQIYRWTFPPIGDSGGQEFEWIVSAPSATAERPVVLRMAPGDLVDGLIHLNLYPVTGNLDFAMYHRGLPGRWWLDALAARVLPPIARTRMQQVKPAWVNGRTLAFLAAAMPLTALLTLVAGLGQWANRWLALDRWPIWCALALVALAVGGTGAWTTLRCATAVALAPEGELSPTQAPAWTSGLAAQPHAAFDMLMSLGDATQDLTRTRDRGRAWAEMRMVGGAPLPALGLAADYALAWRLRVPPGARFRAALFSTRGPAAFELWVSAGGKRERLLQAQVSAGVDPRWVEADLGAYAGQQVKVELLCVGADGYWGVPQLLADGSWLRPWAGTGPAPEEGWRAPTDAGPVRFGSRLDLLGYALDATSLRPGETLALDLYWHAAQRVGVDYTVFVHLIDAQGSYATGQDARPVLGTFPTTLWTPGLAVVDAHRLAIPAGLPPGTYRLAVGLYELATMSRLPASGADGMPQPGDAAWLDQEITVR